MTTEYANPARAGAAGVFAVFADKVTPERRAGGRVKW